MDTDQDTEVFSRVEVSAVLAHGGNVGPSKTDDFTEAALCLAVAAAMAAEWMRARGGNVQPLRVAIEALRVADHRSATSDYRRGQNDMAKLALGALGWSGAPDFEESCTDGELRDAVTVACRAAAAKGAS